jgi:hypothetical protein
MREKGLLIAILMILMLFFGFLFIFFTGNPITRAESKDLVIEYLHENYPDQSFTIEGISYYPADGTYVMHYVSDDRSIDGYIDVRDGKVLDSLVPYDKK